MNWKVVANELELENRKSPLAGLAVRVTDCLSSRLSSKGFAGKGGRKLTPTGFARYGCFIVVAVAVRAKEWPC